MTTRRRPRMKLLFVGTGVAAERHSRTLRRDHPWVARAYLGRSAERAERLARKYGGSVCDRDWAVALGDPSLDAVVITTPPSTHTELTLEALQAGKHVIVEKPAFLEPDDFAHVEAAAERAGRHVCVAENYHYKPLARYLRRTVAGGGLGQIRIIELNAVKLQRAGGWRADPEVAGGGALFEGGIHWVSLLASLGLEVEHVRASFPDAPPGHERTAVVTVEYAQGAIGLLTYSWEVPSTLRGLRLSRIWGTGGSVLFESNGLFALKTGGAPRPSWPGISDISGYRAMTADFVRSIATGTEPDFSLRAARRDVELVRSAYAGATRPVL